MKRLISIIIVTQLTFLTADNYSLSFDGSDDYVVIDAGLKSESIVPMYEFVLDAEQDKIEIGVCNAVALSIYKGDIHNVIHKFNWLNIMDNTFNLHIKDDKINSVLEKYSNKKIIELFNNKMHMLHLQK